MAEIDIDKVNRICAQALETYGEAAQLYVMMEECAEFITAVNHSFRGRPDCLKEVIEEAADVQICLWQMQIILLRMGLADKFAEMVDAKLERLESKLTEAKLAIRPDNAASALHKVQR